MDAFWAAPPISRTIAASAFLLSASLYAGILPGYLVIFDLNSILTLPPQIWRIVTPFLITGKELGIIFDTYFIYQYGSKLESASPRFSNSADFLTYIIFVSAIILGLNIFATGGVVFTSALVLALAYTSSQDDRGHKASFFIITIPALWVPYAMLLMNIIMAGPETAVVQLTGLIAAHLHDFLTRLWPTFGGGRNLVPTPSLIRRLWESGQVTETRRTYGTARAVNSRGPTTSTPSSSNEVLPNSWQSRGSGYRLGGD